MNSTSCKFFYFKICKTLSIPSVPLTIFLETGVFGFITYSLILPILIFLNNNFKSTNVKNIFCLLIIIQLTQVPDISLLRFHMITFLFAMYLGISCNKSVKINAEYFEIKKFTESSVLEWDKFCFNSDDCWLWHTTWNIIKTFGINTII